MYIAGHRFENVGHGSLDSCRYREGGGASILENAQQGAPDAVLPNDIFLWHVTVAHLRYVTYVNHGPADAFDRQVVQ